MTDEATPAAAGSAGVDPANLARIAELRVRRTPMTPSPARVESPASSRRTGRRRHPALGARIAAAGIGATGLFGLVTVLGAVNPADGEGLDGDTDPAIATSTPPTSLAVVAAATGAGVESAPIMAPRATPIYLTANPVVRTITIQPPPVYVTVLDGAQVPAVGGTAARPQPADVRSPSSAGGTVVVAPAPVVVAPAPAPVADAPAPAPAAPAPAPVKTSGSG